MFTAATLGDTPGLVPETTGIYQPRRPQESDVYRVVQHNLESWLVAAREASPDSDPIPGYVEREFRNFLSCGILARGFSRCKCSNPGCGYEYILAFSCRGRGVCPSCGAKYMAQTAAHLTDNVLPRVPYRQWVLTVPRRLRFFLQRNPKHASGVLNILMRALQTTIRSCSPHAPPGSRFGAVSFQQRAGSSINPHPHYHVVATEGVFAPRGGGEVEFFEATEIDQDVVDALCSKLRRRILRYFTRHGLLVDCDAEDMLGWDHQGGFSLDASVRIEDWDRQALERLARYCARHPFAQSRLHRLDDQRVLYELPAGDVHGRDVIVLTPFEFLDRLCLLIPHPRVHRHRYHGVLAPNSPLRSKVIASAGPTAALQKQLELAATRMGIREAGREDHGEAARDSGDNGDEAKPGPQPEAESHTGTTDSNGRHSIPEEKGPFSRRLSIMWAMLLARIYEVWPLACPRCGSPLRVISFITDPAVIEKILRHLDEPIKPPPISPARGPPQDEFYLIDPAPALD